MTVRRKRHSTGHAAGYSTWATARRVLEAVDQWATGATLLRETEQLGGGRFDGVIVPSSFQSRWSEGIYGVEVKVTRSDFLRGLNSGQFERYMKHCSGLYVATPRGVCKTKELPPGCGHLTVGWRDDYGPVCTCRRQAYNSGMEFPVGTLFRIMYQVIQLQYDQWREEEIRDRRRQEEIERTIGRVVSQAVRNAREED